MTGKDGTKGHFMDELAEARARIAELEQSAKASALREGALRESEERFRGLVENARDMIYRMSLPDGRYEYVSSASTALTGYTPGELYTNPLLITEILDPAFSAYFMKEWEKLVRGEVEPSHEYMITHKSGKKRWLRRTNVLVRDESGRPVALEGVVTDITGRKAMEEALRERERVEEALRRSELKNRTLLESISDGVYMIDADGLMTFVNEVITKRSGHPREWFIGRHYRDLIQQEHRELVERNFEKHMQGDCLPPYEIAISYPDSSSTMWVEVHNKLLFDGDRITGILGISRDITARKQMEAELLKKRTLESIGTLAGGIAHDFNNLLMAVTGYISIAKLGIKEESEEFAFLSEAERISLGGKELTRKLITFSEGGISARKVVSMAEIVRDSSPIALTGSNIECLYSLPDDLFPVEADELQIGQAIHNVVLNAREAMPEGGTIEIEGANIIVRTGESLPLTPGEYVRISIKDKGKGIGKEDLPKIFDPYFTTKGMGAERGMGLGLAVAYSALKRHNGHVIVDSLLNRGTTVHIYLPAHGESLVSTSPHEPPHEKKVLFMDDDDNVRIIGGKLIAHLGYKVALASNGNEALTLYTHALDSNEPFDAVILDLTIKGGMGGKEAFDRMRSIDPSIKAIISSGYTDDPAISRYKEYGFKGVMTKPYKVDELKDLLKEVAG